MRSRGGAAAAWMDSTRYSFLYNLIYLLCRLLLLVAKQTSEELPADFELRDEGLRSSEGSTSELQLLPAFILRPLPRLLVDLQLARLDSSEALGLRYSTTAVQNAHSRGEAAHRPARSRQTAFLLLDRAVQEASPA